jgi:putative ABC transport system permease protein
MKLPTIAWRNIWRHKLRSLAVMLSVVLGIYAGIFASALMKGMLEGRFETFIENEISHMQVHHPEFVREPEVHLTVQGAADALDRILAHPRVESATTRVKADGMIASANHTGGIRITGIDPQHEFRTTGLDDHLVEGEHIAPDDRNRIVIGRSLADKMKVGLGSRVVLTFQDAEHEIISAAFTVKGIFRTISNRYDEGIAFVPATYLAEHLGIDGGYHELAVLAREMEDIPAVLPLLRELFPEMRVRSWEEVAPEVALWSGMGDLVAYIFLGVILLGLAFGLLNTMLMTVFERTRELGMLMAIGMNKRKVFGLIVLETLFLSITGAALGLLLGYFTVELVGERGIDLSALSDVMRELGFSSMIHPRVDTLFLLFIPVMVVITALLAAIYPARKALSLNPAEAVRE